VNNKPTGPRARDRVSTCVKCGAEFRHAQALKIAVCSRPCRDAVRYWLARGAVRLKAAIAVSRLELQELERLQAWMLSGASAGHHKSGLPFSDSARRSAPVF